MSTSRTQESGHLFVIDGDIQSVAVDAWYLPLDEFFSSSKAFRKTIREVDFNSEAQRRWADDELARFLKKHNGADVWIGNVGRDEPDATVDHYVKCAMDFLQLASTRWKSENPQKTRLPILAINHIGTGRGGAHFTHGDVLFGIIDAVSGALNNQDLMADVVITSWGRKAASAAQHTRFKRHSDWKSDPQWRFAYNQDQIHERAQFLADRLRESSSSIFLGAGVSKGAGLLGWNELLVEAGKLTSPVTTIDDLNQFDDPRDRAALLETRFRNSQTSIGEALQPFLTSSKYSLQHGLISSLPCSEFITTNIDELFEAACQVDGREIAVIPEKPVGRGPWLLKLHGTVSKPSSIVFTRDHYLSSFRSSRALIGLVQAMLFTRHMLFVGYGLRDEDFHELVYEVKSAFPEGQIKKLGTTIALFDDPLQAEMWSDVLEVVPVRPSTGSRSPSAEEIGAAARDIERFLDLIGMLASSRSAFLLDSNYQGVKSEEEKTAFLALDHIVTVALSHSDKETGWGQVRKLLVELGAQLKDDSVQ